MEKVKEKDPAFLMYSSDFLIGTRRFTNSQTGAYIKLLCLQHQTGYLTSDDFYAECEGIEEDVKVLMGKFHENPDGTFINPRLAREITRRKDWKKQQSEWGKKGQQVKKAKGSLKDTLSSRNENENGNENPLAIDSLEDLYED